jgi:NADPH:quinone reductase-like Zn-dependent oxidoreductase
LYQSSGAIGQTDLMHRLEVVRSDLHRTRIVEAATPDPEPGEVVLAVDAFGLTANNISYAVFGDMLGYWQFFPSEGEWGQVPAWGFADVAASAHPDLNEGDRLFGYVPMATHLVLRPGVVDEGQVVDASPHRAGLPGAYNAYRRIKADPLYDADGEDTQMLLWPLFFTGFVLERFLDANDRFGADTVVLSSASSKTAIATAHCLAARGGARLIGLTSHVDMVRGLGLYDEVVPYDAITGLTSGPAVYVDLAGDAAVRAAVHGHFDVAHSAMVGGTHWGEPDVGDVPDPAPTFFFAPEHWGADAERALPAAWDGFVATTDWLRVEHRTGPDAVTAAYLAALSGDADPAVGLVLSP